MNYYELVQKSIDYIELNLENSIELDKVAQEAHMSLSNFYRVFFAIVGFSVKEYIRFRRLSLACNDILAGDMKIIDIAVKYLYNSADSFSRAVKNSTGFLPRELRTLNKEFIFERIDIMDKYFEIQDKEILKQYPDIKVLKTLDPFKVASYTAYSKTPENDAFKVLNDWACKNGLLKEEKYRIFGFDIPNSMQKDGLYGYEVWMTIKPNFKFVDDKVVEKRFQGGLYAVTSTTIEGIEDTWNRFGKWIKLSKYGLGKHQYLEEHLNFYDFNKHTFNENEKIDLYMPIVLKDTKVKERIKPIKVAYYRAESIDKEEAAMRAWNVMFSWAKRNNLECNRNNHRIFAFNTGFRKTKKFWHEVMITIDDNYNFTDNLVKDKVFEGGNYITMETNLESLTDDWREMGRWKQITKTKTSRHQWIEEWTVEDWSFPEKTIRILYPISD